MAGPLYKVGDTVLIFKAPTDRRQWLPEMDNYIGTKTTVVSLFDNGRPYEGNYYYGLAANKCRRCFVETSLTLPIFNPDQKCKECNTTAPHADPNSDGKYVCAFCKASLELL